jgi:hypothetical protein
MDEKEPKDKKPGRDPDQALDLKELCRVWGPFEADVLKSFLESNGIICLVRGRMAPWIYPFTVDGLAEFMIFVRQKDFETAKNLLASMPPPDGQGGPAEPR